MRQLDPAFLQRAIPVLLLGVAVYTLLKPRLGAEDLRARMDRGRFDLTFGLVIGFYDGFFGPGTGSFMLVALVTLLGFDFMRANTLAKVMNLSTNIAALAYFI
ncbi:MAG: TSUP family transporter, partial [bacterium]